MWARWLKEATAKDALMLPFSYGGTIKAHIKATSLNARKENEDETSPESQAAEVDDRVYVAFRKREYYRSSRLAYVRIGALYMNCTRSAELHCHLTCVSVYSPDVSSYRIC